MKQTLRKLAAGLKKALLAYRDFCFIVGLALLLWLALEALFGGLILGRNLVLFGRTTTQPARITSDWRANADAHPPEMDAPAHFADFDQVAMRWAPYVHWRFEPLATATVNMDERGLRRTEFPAPAEEALKHPDAPPVRVLMLGGSTMWGVGARDAGTIPSLLGAELSRRGYRAEIVNFGQSGYNNAQGLIALMGELQRGEAPDFAVFYDGVNEVVCAEQSGQAGAPQNASNREREFNLTHYQRGYGRLAREFFRATAWNIERQSFLVRVGKKLGLRAPSKKTKPNSFEGESGEALARDVIDHYAANLKMADALAETFDFQALFYWQPSIYDKETLSDYERRLPDYAAHQQSFEKAQTARRDKAPELERAQNFHDISDIFADDPEPRFLDFCHVSEGANAIIAKRMADDLAPLIEARLEKTDASK
jgi:lysophospholipase L1-like esterase